MKNNTDPKVVFGYSKSEPCKYKNLTNREVELIRDEYEDTIIFLVISLVTESEEYDKIINEDEIPMLIEFSDRFIETFSGPYPYYRFKLNNTGDNYFEDDELALLHEGSRLERKQKLLNLILEGFGIHGLKKLGYTMGDLVLLGPCAEPPANVKDGFEYLKLRNNDLKVKHNYLTS